ncbi:MAG: carboxypeptidase-like regulatory domain-containing protein [Candidatus Korobacteraceae bacterium]|jgi:hypothetical protein
MKARRIFSSLRKALIIGVFLLVITPAASAASLRGQLVRVFPNGARAPAPGITVTVYNQALGRSIAVRTDQNGMYYLQLPAGPYYLEVWLSNTPTTYPIQVNEPYTDIPPIAVR